MMIVRFVLPVVLIAASFAQTVAPEASEKRSPSAPVSSATASPVATAASAVNSPAVVPVVSDLPGNAPVITIHGLCSKQHAETTKQQICATEISKDQFEQMIAAMSFNPQALNNPVAIKAFAESYVQALALADAAEKSGLDRNPQVQELMAIARIRTLADAYRRAQKEQLKNFAPEEIEAYYEAHASKFEQVELDRVFIPKSDRSTTKQSNGEFEKKALEIASQLRERATKGEDLSKLQTEAYKRLGLTPPLTTDMGTIRRGALPKAIEEDVFGLTAGELSRVEADAAGFTIYRVRSRASLPLERVQQEIVHELGQRKMDAAAAEFAKQIHSDYNDQFFSTPERKIASNRSSVK